MKNGTNEMHFFYDAQDKPAIVVFNGSSYRYMYILQGDVYELTDENNSWVVFYRYDAWGKPIGIGGSLANTLGVLQPFRYRGYVFNEETGDYYLRSRYYRPEWGRFVSADALIVGALYCYCHNEPICKYDPSGLIQKDDDFRDYTYYSYLTIKGCEHVIIAEPGMEQQQFDLGFTLHPGQYVGVLLTDEENGLVSGKYYLCYLWAQHRDSDKFDNMYVYIEPKYLSDDLGGIKFSERILHGKHQS